MSTALPAPAPVATASLLTSHVVVANRGAALGVMVDAGVRAYAIRGATFLSDGVTVALLHDGAFVQDSALSSTPDCAASDEFLGFAGSWPGSAWALRGSSGSTLETRLLRWNPTATRWQRESGLAGQHALLEQGPGGTGILVTWAEGSPKSGYTLRVLGRSTAPHPLPARPASRGGCATVVVEPRQLVTTERGDVTILGKTCQDGSSRLEQWAPGNAESTVLVPPDGVDVAAIAFGKGASVWIAGGKGPKGYVAARRRDDWRALPPLLGRVTALSATPDGATWAVVDGPAPVRHPDPIWDPVVAAPDRQNLWHLPAPIADSQSPSPAPGWEAVLLPAGVGGARRAEERQPGDVWVTTSAALLRSSPPPTVGRRWTRWPASSAEPCPKPVTGARQYVYGHSAKPWSQLSVESVSNRIGDTDCPRFVVLDESPAASSARFEAALGVLRASWSGGGLEVGERALREGSGFGAFTKVLPVIAFEMGRYVYGFQLEGNEGERAAAVLRAHYRDGVDRREVCARPLPLLPPPGNPDGS